MVQIKCVKLDILKPHHPDILELSRAIATLGESYRVEVTVVEMDDKTETIIAIVTADSIDFSSVLDVIGQMGATLHSVDHVEVYNSPNRSSTVT